MVVGLSSRLNISIQHGLQSHRQRPFVQMGNTSLHLSAYEGHIDLVALLLKHGASINLQNKVGVEFWARNTSIARCLFIL